MPAKQKVRVRTHEINLPNPVFSCGDASVMLGTTARAIADHFRDGTEFQAGTEIFKLGRNIKVDVIAYRERKAEECAQTRLV